MSFICVLQTYDNGFGQGAGRESHGEYARLMVYTGRQYQKCEFASWKQFRGGFSDITGKQDINLVFQLV